MIRVFPRKTNMCPTDDLAFFGGPPLYELPELPVMVSVTFSWDIERGKHLCKAWCQSSRNVYLGGPAFNDMYLGRPSFMPQNIPPIDFVPGRFLKNGITITSRGCPKRCPWCLVPEREGRLREIAIQPGHIVQDNNLLACWRDHVERVFEMLLTQKEPVQFKGGLDIDYLEAWHIDWFKKMRIGKRGLWVSYDCKVDEKRLDKAADLLSDFPIEKKGCYVLVGFNDETQEQAKRRCIAVLQKGFIPHAQLYRGVNSGPSRGEWREFCAFWSQPKYYRKKYG